MISRLTLEELGHPQPKTHVHFDNAMAVGIANITVKRQRLHLMEIRYFWVYDKVAQGAYTINWHPEKENLANYQSKHHGGSDYLAVCPWYLHEKKITLAITKGGQA
jgi:hypothetical protein